MELKRQYNNEGARRGLLSGDQWYSQQAFRALNQAVGRCLRHRADHGAILLADDRYAHGANGDLCRHLPKWLRPATRKCASFEESKRGVRAFFDARAADPPRTRVEPETLALPPSVRDASKSNASCRTRKPREKVRAAADEGEEASNARGAQRDIKNFFAPVGAETGGGGGNVAVDDGGGGVAIENGSSRGVRSSAIAIENGSSRGVGSSAIAIANGSSRGVGSSAVAPGLHPHRVPLELAEARETRRGWTSAPPPPPLESDPRVTSQLTDPPTAPPTQDARTTSTLTEPNDAVTETETTAMTAVERVMERMEREFERRRGRRPRVTRQSGRETCRRRRACHRCRPRPRVCRRRAWIARGTLRRRLASGLPRRNPRRDRRSGAGAGGAASTTTRRDGVGRPPRRPLRAPGGPGGAPRSSFAIPSRSGRSRSRRSRRRRSRSRRSRSRRHLRRSRRLWTPREGRNPSLKNLNRR